MTILWWAIAILLVAGLLIFIVQGANNPKDPHFDTNSLPCGSLVRDVGSSLALPSPTLPGPRQQKLRVTGLRCHTPRS
jgi:hypothetical protein